MPLASVVFPAPRLPINNTTLHVENQFHAFLRDADHDGVRGTRTGAEWFLTSLKFLDRIATTLGLEIRIINDFTIEDEH